MSVDPHIAQALAGFITATGTQERAVLIGGQAIRDWHAAQTHALTGVAVTIPIPRTTTDMDVHLLIEKEERASVAQAITSDWTPQAGSGDRAYSFLWKQDPSITLDLIACTDAQARTRVQFLAKLGTGTDIGAVRVLAPWIIEHHLHERCFNPALAQLRLRRLNRLGLAAAKADAIGATIGELIAADREQREPKPWARRLDKDLQDLDLLLQTIWIDGLWEPRYGDASDSIKRAWARTVDALATLKQQPRLMGSNSYARCEQVRRRLPRHLES